MERPLVTLLCPCYNAHDFLCRFLDSVAAQTYKNIQIIMINDGSADDTLDILRSYSDKMAAYAQYLVLDKENGGAASAINMALPYVEGEYLAWADCDDILYEENINKKVEFLEQNPDCGLVNCQAEAFEEGKDGIIGLLAVAPEYQQDNIFEMLIHPGVPCYPGVFMVRTKLLFSRLESRTIVYHREVGQNWQLLLPVAYDSKCGYINEPLYGYCIRANSHSHNTNLLREYNRIDVRVELLNKIMSFLPEKDFSDWTEKNAIIFTQVQLQIALAMHDSQKVTEKYRFLEKKGSRLGLKTYLKCCLHRFPFVYRLCRKCIKGKLT